MQAIRPRCRRRAFTLIELLTVIAIVGVLAAIILPTLSTVRRAAAKAEMTNNLRQLGVAYRLYLQDYKRVEPLSFIRASDQAAHTQLDPYATGRAPMRSLLTSRLWSQMTNANPDVRAFTVNQYSFSPNPNNPSVVTTTPSDRILKLARTPALWPGVKGDQTNPGSAAYNYGYRNHVNYLFSGTNKTTVTDNPNERGVAPVLFWDGSVVVTNFRSTPLNFAGGL